jgi:hypothetical protein
MLDGLKERISKSAKIHQSVGIVVPINNYNDLFEAIFNHMLSTKEDIWLYISVTKSFDTINKTFKNLGDHKNIKFIDCISRAAGISRTEKNVIYIESPALLEKLILEMMHIFYNAKGTVKKYVVIDSLSALMIYNNRETVKEFFQHLINKTRAEDIHLISLVLEEELDDYVNKIIFLNDKIIKVKESFI